MLYVICRGNDLDWLVRCQCRCGTGICYYEKNGKKNLPIFQEISFFEKSLGLIYIKTNKNQQQKIKEKGQ
jgi:hypothetical protein